MKELYDILTSLNESSAGQLMALATVLHVDGSSYRKAGARMLIFEDGSLTGSISGGCLEGDALRKAQHVMLQQQARTVIYDTSDEDDALIGAQLGCEGRITVLLEPLSVPGVEHLKRLLQEIVVSRMPGVFVTIYFPGRPADRTVHAFATSAEKIDLPASINTTVTPLIAEAIHSGKSSFTLTSSEGASLHVLCHAIKPAIQMVICGAGNDAQPLAAMARMQGWQVSIADGRPALIKADRFAAGCSLLVARPQEVFNQITADENTVVILLTHNYVYDKTMLEYLLDSPVCYIGLLGPRKKLERMQQDWREEGKTFSAANFQKLFSPTGLHIGAQGPEEIAASIIAEIIAVRNNATGGNAKRQNGF